jgi:hypothetical protein
MLSVGLGGIENAASDPLEPPGGVLKDIDIGCVSSGAAAPIAAAKLGSIFAAEKLGFADGVLN